MADRHGDPRFYALLEEIAELHSRKNHDYAKTTEPLSNFNRAKDLGVEPWRGVLIRMSDKWSRIEQLAGGKIAKNESLRDSLVDLAVYALIDVLLLEDEAKPRLAAAIERAMETHNVKVATTVTAASVTAAHEFTREQAEYMARPFFERTSPTQCTAEVPRMVEVSPNAWVAEK